MLNHPHHEGAGVVVARLTPKGDRTRSAILTAARDLFHELGFEAASVRLIASRAEIDPAMVLRYFGSKQGLFAAAIDVNLDLPDLTQVPKSRRGRALVRHFIERWEGDVGDDALVMLLRSSVANEDASARLRMVFAEQVIRMLAPILPAGEVDRRAGLVSAQMLGVALTRYVLRLPAVAALSPEQLVDAVGPTLQRYIGGRL